MNRDQTIQTIKDYLSQFPITKIGIFGSFARNEEGEDSDIDILVTFEEAVSLFTLVRMHRELSELLNRKVDIVSEKYLHPRLKASIEKDLKIIAA
ncbi:MAG: nucleotidyltransferase family protein [Lewinellaceae bacterium]|nr:nucleotidyltransferase family protein [Lewinellaceae bacterium]